MQCLDGPAQTSGLPQLWPGTRGAAHPQPHPPGMSMGARARPMSAASSPAPACAAAGPPPPCPPSLAASARAEGSSSSTARRRHEPSPDGGCRSRSAAPAWPMAAVLIVGSWSSTTGPQGQGTRSDREEAADGVGGASGGGGAAGAPASSSSSGSSLRPSTLHTSATAKCSSGCCWRHQPRGGGGKGGRQSIQSRGQPGGSWGW